MRTWDAHACREQFPALRRTVHNHPAVYFDGPAGSQVPARVIEAVSRYLAETNANHDAPFATSRESDAILNEAHRAVADFLGTAHADCVVFGPNMTTLTFALSRSLARTWNAGDEVIVTQLEHDANYTPWVLAARDAGATVQRVAIDPDDCTLDLDDFKRKLSRRTKLVAVCCASNAVGTIPPFQDVIRMAHDAGALVFLDAVHYAPHLRMNVGAWGCDFIACSAYKFFGPHVGVLWGRREHLESLPAYKVRPAPDDIPGRWMTGTQCHEGIAGTLAAVEYLADHGRSATTNATTRRGALDAAYTAIETYERALAAELIGALRKVSHVRIWGITDPNRLPERVPTVSFTHERLSPREIAVALGQRGIFVWHGNYYALPLTEALGLEPEGMVRVGLLHYNTPEEIKRLAATLTEL